MISKLYPRPRKDFDGDINETNLSQFGALCLKSAKDHENFCKQSKVANYISVFVIL